MVELYLACILFCMDFWLCMDLTFAHKRGVLNCLERERLVVVIKIDGIADGRKTETDNID